jgi:hypothetical protein
MKEEALKHRVTCSWFCKRQLFYRKYLRPRSDLINLPTGSLSTVEIARRFDDHSAMPIGHEETLAG